MIEELVAWSTEVFLPYGPLGLFIVAFIESSFFPIPPDLLLIPLCLVTPGLSLFYALVAMIGSVSGAFLGYYIGLKGGRPALNKVAGRATKKVEKYFSRYGTWAIAIAGFTPIPYKIFTIAAGVFKHDIKKVFLASLIGRSGRFFLGAIVVMLWGEEIIFFIENYFGLVTILIVAGVIAAYLIYKRLMNSSNKNRSS